MSRLFDLYYKIVKGEKLLPSSNFNFQGDSEAVEIQENTITKLNLPTVNNSDNKDYESNMILLTKGVWEINSIVYCQSKEISTIYDKVEFGYYDGENNQLGITNIFIHDSSLDGKVYYDLLQQTLKIENDVYVYIGSKCQENGICKVGCRLLNAIKVDL